jgi:hypothetical protein
MLDYKGISNYSRYWVKYRVENIISGCYRSSQIHMVYQIAKDQIAAFEGSRWESLAVAELYTAQLRQVELPFVVHYSSISTWLGPVHPSGWRREFPSRRHGGSLAGG